MKYKILLNKGITPKNTEGNMYAKICEAMEDYHQSELLKLNKSDVIKSVGDLNGKTIPVKFKVSKLKTKIYLDD